jgi:parallel beta-helix repeat protein
MTTRNTNRRRQNPGSCAGGRRRFSALVLGSVLLAGGELASLEASAPLAAASPGQTLLVSTTGTDSGNCLTTACRTLGYALSQAVADDTILLEAGRYLESQNHPGTENVIGASLSPLKIASQSGSASNTIIDATGEPNGIVVNADDVTIQNLTVVNAGAEGIVVMPPASDAAPANVTGETIQDDVVEDNDQCVSTPGITSCRVSSPADGYGGGIHLESVASSTVTGNTVEHNSGGILLSDEVGPSDDNVINGNDVSYNAGESGIMLEGDNSQAVVTSGPDTGQPRPASAGVFDNRVNYNLSDHDGGSGILVTATVEGAGAYDNTLRGDTATNDGSAGVMIQSRTAAQDVNENAVQDNILSEDAVRDGPGGSQGDSVGPPESGNLDKTAGVQVLATLAPIYGTSVSGNTISGVFYGVWISALASPTAVSGNRISVGLGGEAVFEEPGPYSGYWMGAADGGAFAFGSAGFHGSAPGSVLGAPTVGIASTPDGGGYWLCAANGKVVGLGDAIVYGTLKRKDLAAPIVGIAPTPDGGGYWLVGSDGGVFAFGDARFFGSVPGVLRAGQRLGAPIIAVASTPDGGGYWLVGSDGGVFSFGDAGFFGSVPGALKPGAHLSSPIVGIAASPGAFVAHGTALSGDGYWLVGSDGGVFSFGKAGFFGSVPGALKRGAHLSAPIVGIAASPGVLDASTSDLDSDGYWLAGADGGMFAFGQARYVGSVPGALKPGQHLAAPVVSVAGA